MEVSRRTEEFCLQHGIEKKKAMQMGLFVEEMASNVIEVAEKRGTENASVDFRLNISGEKISFSLMDLSGQANPQLFYEMNRDKDPEKFIGARMVAEKSREMRYFSTFGSNNLVVCLE